MEGITFAVDDKGRRASVIIDLKKHAALWEDIYDSLLVEQRKGEPRKSFSAVAERFERKAKQRSGVKRR